MKSDYLFRIEHETGEVFSFDVHATRSSVDKLFFSFAFCLPSSSVHCVELFLRHPTDSILLKDALQLVNKAEKKCV